MNLSKLRNFFFGTLRGQLILSVALVHAVMMTLFILDLSLRQRTLLHEQRQREAKGIALTLSTSAASWLEAYDTAGLQELVETQRRNPDLKFAILTGRDGQIFAHTDKARKGEFLLDLPQSPRQKIISDTPDLVDIAAPAMLAGQHVGWVRVGLGNKTSLKQLAAIILNGTFYAFVAILVGAFIAWRMGLRLTRRLYVVQATTSAVQSGNRTARCDVTGSDEAAQLGRDFNLMLDSLADVDSSLRQSEARYKSLFDESPVAIWEEDLSIVKSRINALRSSGISDLRAYFEQKPEEVAALAGQVQILAINQRSLELFGVESVEQITQNFPSYFTPASMQVFKEELLALIAGQKRFQAEAPYLNAQGEKLILDLSVVIQPDCDESLCRVLVSFRDITKIKQAEEEREVHAKQLRQTHKMEVIGTLAGGIAHDFNNLLAIIRGNLDIIQLKKKTGKSSEKNLEHIEIATTRAAELVKQILTFSRQEDNIIVPTNLTVAVTESIGLLRSTIPSTIEIISPVACPAIFINANMTQLQQVVINLCSNAVHAMGGNGRLRAGLEEVELDDHEIPDTPAQQAGHYARLSINDCGSGMDAATLAKIFDPFFTTKGVGKGTGMGLSVVHGIVEQFGGFIIVDSTLGQGTTFHLYFRTVKEAVSVADAETTEPLPHGTGRILFVDDEAQIASLSKELLESQGYQTMTTSSSIKALEIFKDNPDQFDLVITDQAMPEMTGLELTRELLKIRPDIPVILCSGYSATTTEEVAKGMGVREFCMKPLEAEQLFTVVKRVLAEAGRSVPSI
ncbi:response regulator [Geopsychrobacter electrodiphilus]|uniref:response regulator n=1 Tax=Geopsychrobacter electrodiphilus TaxID=225196 RepID=UPI00037D6A75|nr:response regulator [Geopsychrobacter electrodiphilus]